MRRSIMILIAILFLLPFASVASACPLAYCLYVPFAGSAESATPQPTAAPTLTSTPAPSATPTLTSTPAPSATPTASAEPTPTATAPSRIAWSAVADAPISRSEGQGVTVDGRLYVFGGYTDTTYIPLSRRADVYDPRSDSWDRLPDMPMAITHAGAATDGAHIYLAGGVVGSGAGDKLSATTAVWRYTIATEQWTSIPSLPEPRGAGELALLGRTLHFFGGTGIDRYTSEDEHWTLALDGGTQWIPAASLPNARNHLAAAIVDGALYVIGGQHGHNETLVTQRSVQLYDADHDQWIERAPLPAGRSHIATVVANGHIFVLGGEEQHGVAEDTVFVYDPQANAWTFGTSLPQPRLSGVAAVIDGAIFYTGGSLERMTYKGELSP